MTDGKVGMELGATEGSGPFLRKAIVRGILYGVLALTVAALSASFSYRLLSFGEETRVPALIGRSMRDAQDLAEERKVQIKVTASAYHADIPVGFVADQTIPPGTTVKQGKVVSVVLSKGPSTALIPDFRSQKLEEARFLAVEKGLVVDRISFTHHDSVPGGQVVAQNPNPGTQKSSVVNLLVSLGPYTVFVDVPDLLGMSRQEARSEIVNRGLTFLYTGSGRLVIRQIPNPGTRLTRGDAVEVHLSDSPDVQPEPSSRSRYPSAQGE